VLVSCPQLAREEDDGDLLVANPNHAGRSMDESEEVDDSESEDNASEEEGIAGLESKMSKKLILETKV
jgi:hypothetical protein